MKERLGIVFMGSPEFSVPALRTLHERHRVLAVVTQPDRPKGRGRELQAPAVKLVAEDLGLPVLQPPKLRHPEARAELQKLGADLFVVVAFGQILSPAVLAIPPLGCLNIHASLLPRYRGAAPMQWAILRGERESGVTIMQMDAGVDTGPILLQESVTIGEQETAGTLHDRLAPLGAELLVRALERLAAGDLPATPQEEGLATHAPLLKKEDGRVDFSRSARDVDCWIRGMDPWPGAFVQWEGETVKVFRSRCDVGEGAPGEILLVDHRGVLVACGEGAVWIGEVQRPGRRRMTVAALVAGRPLHLGMRIG
ncbi:MAG: methionyl-tRNA formyltransferase [Deltaproteobacteria bacterium]|nr:methionyl-tRNA formyltransferase [Deltaproteobacteria bacterium]